VTDRHHVRIEYCVPWGALPNAAGLAARLLEEWEAEIGVVEVVTGANGIFDVHLDGELVFEKSMLGRYPEPDDVVPLFRERLGG
jgi:selenoprotein W-related protein